MMVCEGTEETTDSSRPFEEFILVHKDVVLNGVGGALETLMLSRGGFEIATIMREGSEPRYRIYWERMSDSNRPFSLPRDNRDIITHLVMATPS